MLMRRLYKYVFFFFPYFLITSESIQSNDLKIIGKLITIKMFRLPQKSFKAVN